MPAIERTAVHRSRARWALLVAASHLGACTGPGSSPGGRSARELETIDSITRTVHAQEAAWNRGDLVAFMQLGYWNSPELTFYSGGQVSRGFGEMLAHYRRSYEGPGKELGTLTFTGLQVEPLSDDAAVARGRWDLDYAAKDDTGGLFTLVLRKFDDGWRIVHDHSSADG